HWKKPKLMFDIRFKNSELDHRIARIEVSWFLSFWKRLYNGDSSDSLGRSLPAVGDLHNDIEPLFNLWNQRLTSYAGDHYSRSLILTSVCRLSIASPAVVLIPTRCGDHQCAHCHTSGPNCEIPMRRNRQPRE